MSAVTQNWSWNKLPANTKYSRKSSCNINRWRLSLSRAKFPSITFEKVTRASNGKADALARVAKELAEPGKNDIHITVSNRLCLASALSKPDDGPTDAFESLPWRTNRSRRWRDGGRLETTVHRLFQTQEIARRRFNPRTTQVLRFVFTNESRRREKGASPFTGASLLSQRVISKSPLLIEIFTNSFVSCLIYWHIESAHC